MCFFFIYSFSLNFSTDPLVLLLGVPGPSLEKPLKKYTRYGNTLSKTILQETISWNISCKCKNTMVLVSGNTSVTAVFTMVMFEIWLHLTALTRLVQQLDGLAVEVHGFSILTGSETVVTGLFEFHPWLRAPLLRHVDPVTIKDRVNPMCG